MIERLRRTYEGKLESILAEGGRSGAFDVPEPKIAAFAIIAMLTGVGTWYRAGGRLNLTEVEAIYWDMARRAILAHP